MSDNRFENRVAIVTGASLGIGRATAIALGQAGASVVVNYRSSPEEAAEVVDAIVSAGGNAIAHQADVADHGPAKEVAAAVLDAWGRIDVLVNNAGRSMPTGLRELSEEQWDATIDVNLKSCFNYIQAVVPAMDENGFGRIISMSSLNAHSGGVTAAVSKVAYAAEGGLFQRGGFPTVICGPGSIAQVHQPNEWIALEQMEKRVAFMARLAQELT